MKKLWETYLTNAPVFSIGDFIGYVLLYGLLMSEIVFWKAFLFYITFYILYHFIRGFLKAAFLKQDH